MLTAIHRSAPCSDPFRSSASYNAPTDISRTMPQIALLKHLQWAGDVTRVSLMSMWVAEWQRGCARRVEEG